MARDAAQRLTDLLREIARDPIAERRARWRHALQPGLTIGRFLLLREAGRGGFGIVFEARDLELGRAVALKVVEPGPPLEENAPEGSSREAEAAARLSHPNIVTLFDAGLSEHGPYLVFEFLRGATLADRLARGPLPIPETLRIAVEIAKGLAHAHGNGVVHRDLKPANVFLCEDGAVKLLDLGMAHAFGRRRCEGGTRGYMAPEQRRRAPEDERSDVYSLGVILHQMLANEHPFRGDQAHPFAGAPVLDVPGMPTLGPLVARMMERDPVRRPRDGAAVLAGLLPLLPEANRSSSGERAVVRRRPSPLARVAVLSAVTALAVASAVWWRGSGSPPADGAGQGVRFGSIAVLPFDDLSPAKDQDWFSDGLADDILNELGRIDGLRVTSRTSSFFFKGRHATVSDIREKLKVDALLEGSVRRSGAKVRVTTQLVNVRDGYRVWEQTYDRELNDIFAVQDDIAHAVAESLHVQLLDGRSPVTKDRSTEKPDAYTHYLLARQQYYRFTPASLRMAVEGYERALAVDPTFAPAWAGLAIPLFALIVDATTQEEVDMLRRKALAAAEKAVALAPTLADALSARGLLRGFIEYDWSGARADLEAAIAANGSDADARRRYASVLEQLGRLPEAIAQARKAVDIDPLGPAWSKLGGLYQVTGQLGEAEDALRRQLRIAPESEPALELLGRNLLLQRRPGEALAVFARCSEPTRLWGTATAEHDLGREETSRAALAKLTEKYGRADPFYVAGVHAWRGEKDEAFVWLTRAVERRVMGPVRSDPFLRSLRDDPRYAAVLRRINLPVDAPAAPR